MTPKKGADGRWHAWVTVGTKQNGRPDQRHVSRATRDEAKDEVDRLLGQKRDAVVPKTGKKPTLADWLETYLSTLPPSKVDPTSVRDYESKMRNYVIPIHGKVRLDKLTATHLNEIYLAMEHRPLAPSTILKTHRILSRALSVARKRKLIGANPAGDLESTPGGKNQRVKPLALKAAQASIAAAGERRNRSRWAVALSLGLRQGEALGLRWADVDLDAGELRVEWQLHRRAFLHGCGGQCGKRRAGNCPQRQLPLKYGEKVIEGGLILKPPKADSVRGVPLSAELVAELRRQREVQDLERQMAGGAWKGYGFVWAGLDGSPIPPDQDYHEWKELAAAGGAPQARLHDARHLAASLLLALGYGIEVAQELLGHADVRTTRGYRHVASDLLRKAAGSSGAALLGGGGTP